MHVGVSCRKSDSTLLVLQMASVKGSDFWLWCIYVFLCKKGCTVNRQVIPRLINRKIQEITKIIICLHHMMRNDG